MDSSLIYLVQADTTVGFASKDFEKLNIIKNRDKKKQALQTSSSFEELKKHTHIPKNFRRFVRKSKKTTFIYPNNSAFRVVQRESKYYGFISKFSILYSTSANENKKHFSYDYAIKYADVEVISKEGFKELKASNIYKLGKKTIKKFR